MTTSHTVLEEKFNISQKMTTRETWTFYFRPLLLFARLSYYFIPCLRLTKSSTLLPAPLLASTKQVSLVVIENVTDIFFSKWPLLERCSPQPPSLPKPPQPHHPNQPPSAPSAPPHPLALFQACCK